MKNDEFLARIAELAEIEYQKVPEVVIRSKKQEEEFPPPFPPGENPTLGFRITRIRNQNRLCELGCGQIVESQVIERKFNLTPEPHWKTRCATCQNYVHPSGQGFIRGGHQVQNEYVKAFRNSKYSKPQD